MPSKRSVVKGIGAALAVLTAIGAGGLANPAKAAEDITYLLPAPPLLPAFGPWMLALSRGYYAQEGLNVTFQAAKGGVDVAKQVGAGNAPIGGGIGDTPIIVRDNGIPVKAVAVLGGRSMTQIVARKDSGIKGPEDLKGKTITVLAYQDTTYYALLGALASVGLSKADVSAQAAGPQGVWQNFLAGQADAMASVPDWIAIAQGQGIAVEIMPVEKYFPSMAQAIIASDEMIAKNPELIGKLVRATLKGLNDIMADPKGVVADYVKAVPQNAGKEAAMEATFKLYNEYVYPGQATLGAMDPKRLEIVQKFYVDQGFVKAALPLDDLYTNQFVK